MQNKKNSNSSNGSFYSNQNQQMRGSPGKMQKKGSEMSIAGSMISKYLSKTSIPENKYQ